MHLELSKGLESDAEDVYLGRRGPDRPGAWAAGRGAPACPPNPGTARRRFRDPRTTGTTTVASETTTNTRLELNSIRNSYRTNEYKLIITNDIDIFNRHITIT